MGARALERAQASGSTVEVGQAALDRTEHIGDVAARFDPEGTRLRLHFSIADHRTALPIAVVSLATHPGARWISRCAASRFAALVCKLLGQRGRLALRRAGAARSRQCPHDATLCPSRQ